MFSKSFTASILLLALTSSVNAAQGGTIVSPPLGGPSNPGPNDVQRPSESAPCGNMPIGPNFNSSTALTAGSDGKFTPNIISLVNGSEGSQEITTLKVDDSGKGINFMAAQMVTNGDPKPQTAGTRQVTGQLPNGIKCRGGEGQNCCLASLTTTAGYGNCVVVCQPPETTGQNSTYTDEETTKTDPQNGGQNGGQKDGQNGNQKDNQNGSQTGSQNGSQNGTSQTTNQKRMIRKRRL